MNNKENIIKIIKGFAAEKRIFDLNFIPDRNLTKEIPLIVTTAHDVVAFSELNGDLDLWKKIVSKFQKIYIESFSQEWRTKNLELAFLADEKFPLYLMVSVEEDQYFCRKYVLNKNRLEEEIERLPFISFSIIRPNAIKIFKGAREVLKLHNVHEELAKHLSKTGKKIDTLVEESLKGNYGLPEFKTDVSEETLYSFGREEKSLSPVKLKEMKIRNFRAYKGEHIFDLNAEVIILFGKNGLGKTSFFNAIDFAITGGVEYIEKIFRNNNIEQKKPLKHLSANESECEVELSVINEDESSVWIRKLSDHRNYIRNLEEKVFTTENFIRDIITKSVDSLSTLNIWRLRNLFRATHLFGQDISELTGRIKFEGLIEGEILSRLIALQDYFDVSQKTDGILKILEKDIEEERQNKNKLEVFKEELSKSIHAIEEQDNKEEKIKEILNSVIRVMKINKDKNLNQKCSTIETPDDLFREYKLIETIIEESKSKELQKLDILRGGYEKIISFPKALKSLSESEEKIMKLDKEIKEKQQEDHNLVETIKKEQDKNESLETIQHEKQNEVVRVKWALNNKSKLKEFDGKIIKLEGDVKKLTNLKDKLEKKEEEKLKDIEIHDDLKKQKESLEIKLNRLNYLIEEHDSFLIQSKKMSETKQKIKTIDEEIKKINDIMIEKKNIYNQHLNNIEKIKLRVNEEKKGSSVIVNLLERIKTQINTSKCPVCSAEYSSKEEILDAVDKNIATFGVKISKLEKDLIDAEDELRKLKSLIQEKQAEITIKNNNLVKEKELEESLASFINDYKVKARLFNQEGLAKERFQNLKESLKKSLGDINLKLEKHKDYDKEVQNKEDSLNIDEILLKIDQSNSARDELLKDRELLLEEAKIKRINLNSDTESLKEQLKSLEKNILEIKNNYAEKLSEIEKFNKSSDKIRKNIVILKEELNSIKFEKIGIEKQIREVEDILKKLNLNSAICSSDKLKDEIRNIGDAITSFEGINEKISLFNNYYNKIIQERENQAVLKRISEIDETINSYKLKIEKLEKWKNFYRKINIKIGKVQNESVSIYTESFGPAASKIQNKLRKLNGFGLLKLIPQEKTILVNIENQFPHTVAEDLLSANAYLSASQMQLITLSIFLSAATSQTWSNFATILLDDPVQHFDDLNCHNFADLIRNFVSNGNGGNYQFIISTCDELFFNILRKKLPANKIKTFLFEEINERGPVISVY